NHQRTIGADTTKFRTAVRPLLLLHSAGVRRYQLRCQCSLGGFYHAVTEDVPGSLEQAPSASLSRSAFLFVEGQKGIRRGGLSDGTWPQPIRAPLATPARPVAAGGRGLDRRTGARGATGPPGPSPGRACATDPRGGYSCLTQPGLASATSRRRPSLDARGGRSS